MSLVGCFGETLIWVREWGRLGTFRCNWYFPSTPAVWSPCSLLYVSQSTSDSTCLKLNLVFFHPSLLLLQCPFALYKVPIVLLVAYSGHLNVILEFFSPHPCAIRSLFGLGTQHTLLESSLSLHGCHCTPCPPAISFPNSNQNVPLKTWIWCTFSFFTLFKGCWAPGSCGVLWDTVQSGWSLLMSAEIVSPSSTGCISSCLKASV